MTQNQEISGAELTVMKALWQGNCPMKVQDVCDALSGSKWKYKTVATLLLRLEEIGAVICQKDGRTNCYTPVLDKEEYTKAQTKNFVQKLYNGSAKALAVSLFQSDDMTKDDIEEIRRLFDL